MSDPDFTHPAPAQKGKGLAIGSLVCGIAGFVTCGIGSIAGLILGIISLAVGRPGKGLAIAGIVTSGLSLFIVPFFAIIAAITIPNLLESRIIANEIHASSTLKSQILVAQQQYQQRTTVDGGGSYGSMEDLLAAGLLPASFANGAAVQGYHFNIYLPGSASAGPESGPGASVRQTDFIAYAWPETFGETGRHTFALTAEGAVLTTPPDATTGRPPAWNACLEPDATWQDLRFAWKEYHR